MSQAAENGHADAEDMPVDWEPTVQGAHDVALREGAQESTMGPNVSGAVLKQLTQTDLSALSERSQDLLSNLVTQDWVLGYYSKAEHWELKVRLEIIKEQFYAMHPSSDCPIQGVVRAYVYDDEDAKLQPLTQVAKFQVETFFEGLKTRLTRGKDGHQLENLNKSINESHVLSERGEESERTGLAGLRSGGS